MWPTLPYLPLMVKARAGFQTQGLFQHQLACRTFCTKMWFGSKKVNIVHQDGNQIILKMQCRFGRTGWQVRQDGLGLVAVGQSRGCVSHTRREPLKEPRQRISPAVFRCFSERGTMWEMTLWTWQNVYFIGSISNLLLVSTCIWKSIINIVNLY